MAGFSTGDFMQEFLEEADEYIRHIHQNLLILEAWLNQSTGSVDSAAAAVERIEVQGELFRFFHTLKGLSGMVGLQSAAEISHMVETVLHALQNGEIVLHQELIDLLFRSTHTLSVVIDTVRNPNQSMPDIEEELQALTKVLDVSTAASGEQAVVQANAGPVGQGNLQLVHDQDQVIAEDQSEKVQQIRLLPGLQGYPEMLKALEELEIAKIQRAIENRQSLSMVIFASSVERSERGENVDLLRRQVQEQGMVIKAVPMMEGGMMRFLFLTASPQPLDPQRLIADEVIPLAAEVQPAAQQPPKRGGGSAGPGSTTVRHEPVVRVNLERLDTLMQTAGELLNIRSRLGYNLSQLDGVTPAQRRELNLTYQQFGKTIRNLRRSILHARMVPLSEVFERMILVVRDMARISQKDVHLVIEGERTEVDKLLVEQLLDPLIHLVRNAITHGIESPDERIAAGKPAQGTLTLRGIPAGDHILIEVVDDGRGIDLKRVSQRAAQLGLIPSGKPVSLDDALNFIRQAGFSTQAQVDMGAGRGMGLDVVQRMVNSFGGQLLVESNQGQGTLFRLRLPLTLLIVDVLLVRTGLERYAVARDDVERVIEIDPARIVHIEGDELLPISQKDESEPKTSGEEALPAEEGSIEEGEEAEQRQYYVLHRLDDLLKDSTESNGHSRIYGLVVSSTAFGHEHRQVGKPVLVVERVMEMREVVVHPLTDPFLARPGLEGATEMGDGSVVLLLDLPALVQMAKKG